LENRIKIIEEKLTKALNPKYLKVEDESHKHVGHAGAQDGRGHFKVEIVADIFADKSLVERHQLVYQALGDLMKTDIHALSIKAKTSNEFHQT